MKWHKLKDHNNVLLGAVLVDGRASIYSSFKVWYIEIHGNKGWGTLHDIPFNSFEDAKQAVEEALG